MKPRQLGVGVITTGIVLGWLPGVVFAKGLAGNVQDQLQTLNTQGLNQALDRLMQGSGGIALPGIGQVARDLLHRQNPFNPNLLLQGLEKAALGDFNQMARILGILFILAVLAAVLERLAESTELPEVVRIARWVVLSAFLTVGLRSFASAVSIIHHMVSSLVGLMESMIPTVVVLMAGSGALTSAGIFHPMMLATINLIAVLTKNWVLPAMMLATVVELVSYWLPRFSLSNLAGLFRQIGLTLLGGLMTVFLGVMAVEGAAASVADGVMLRSSKFLVGTFVPVIGSAVSDAMQAVLGSSLLLKNAVSLVGALAIIVLVVFPLLKLMVMMFLYRVAASATEPLAVDGMSKSLNTMATAIGWLVAIGGAVALMFFLIVTVVLSASNGVFP
ncbi:MAG: stage III sporulation protein AE [Firmicutes bacterium]|jgi:stage III sporulation protein AE|nr:stage III sporulation protein AE [Bacillota bacterium]MCL5065453.1 stage III sporulation protein AE [Bacillota bacterium]